MAASSAVSTAGLISSANRMSAPRSRSAADHRRAWSRVARLATRVSPRLTAVMSSGLSRHRRRARSMSRPRPCSRSRAPPFRNSRLTSWELSRLNTRSRSAVSARRTDRWRPVSSSRSSRTSRRVPAMAPSSSLVTASRAWRSRPVSTVSRGWNVSAGRAEPGSGTRRWNRMNRLSTSGSPDLNVWRRWQRVSPLVTDSYHEPAGGREVRCAPLAQSAEHSHGKAGVVGSIPTGGSAGRSPCPGRRSSVGRANGS